MDKLSPAISCCVSQALQSVIQTSSFISKRPNIATSYSLNHLLKQIYFNSVKDMNIERKYFYIVQSSINLLTMFRNMLHFRQISRAHQIKTGKAKGSGFWYPTQSPSLVGDL